MKLTLADALKLPADEAITQKYGFIGRSGSGKSYAAMRLAELFLQHDGQIIALDWVGIWWSLRLADNGKDAGFRDVYIFGGEHADIALQPESGALMADLVVDRHISVVLDVMHFRKAERTRFATAFAEQFFHRKKTSRTACHLFIEEAQAYLPQLVRGDEARMVGVFEDIGKVGRNYGIGTSLISQRPQAINKDVLNQVEVLLAFQTNGPQERKAIAGWTAENTDAGAAMIRDLPKLHVGDALVWSPQWLRIATQAHISERITYDASSTPTQKARAIKPQTLAKADLERLGEQMAATIEKAKADDPRELRKQIKALEAQVVGKAMTAVAVHIGKAKSVLTETDRGLLKTLTEGLENIRDFLTRAGAQLADEGERRFAMALQDFKNDAMADVERMRLAFERRLEAKGVQQILDKLAAVQAPVVTPITPKGHGPGHAVPPIRQAKHVAMPDGAQLPDVKLNRLAERKVLQVLAVHGPRTKRQLAIQAGYAAGGGGFLGALSKLKTAGLIQTNGSGTLIITVAGSAAIGEVDPLPVGSALVAYWLQQFNRLAEREVLRVVVESYPESVTAEEVAARTHPPYESKGGGFLGAVSKLRTLGLVEGRGTLRASDDLF